MKRLFTALLATITLFGTAQNGLHLDGVDDHIQTTYTGISGSAARTVEAWIKTSATAVSNQQVITDWGSMSTGTRFTMNLLWSNSIRLEAGGNGLSGTTPVNDGNWHHVAAVYDPLATNSISLYIDGVLEVAGNLTVSINTASTVALKIGERLDGINNFEGTIDEVRIWDVARSATEIANNYNVRYCSSRPNLVAHYTLNHGIANGSNSGITTAIDGVSGNNGTLTNFSLSGATSNWVTGTVLVGTSTTSAISATACNEYISPSGLIWTTANTYTDTIPNAAGCDSIITVMLTINNVDNTLTQSGVVLNANETNATYQWLDCTAGYSAIVNETNQTFTASLNGSYAVEVIHTNGCIDTSDCQIINDVGLNDLVPNGISLYPNPTEGDLTINFDQGNEDYLIRVTDIQGKTISEIETYSEKGITINLDIPQGVYFIVVVDKYQYIVERKKLVRL